MLNVLSIILTIQEENAVDINLKTVFRVPKRLKLILPKRKQHSEYSVNCINERVVNLPNTFYIGQTDTSINMRIT